LSSLRTERGNRTRLAKHFVDFARVQFLSLDHLSGLLAAELTERHVATPHGARGL
jgi:hypothetical protein